MLQQKCMSVKFDGNPYFNSKFMRKGVGIKARARAHTHTHTHTHACIDMIL
jgi:hypothetical protein